MQQVVSAIGIGPLAVGNYAGCHLMQVLVDRLVASHHHGGVSLVEFFHHRAQRIGRGKEVVAVEPDGKPPAARIIDGLVPASTDTQVVAVGDDMNQSGVGGKAVDNVGGAVGGVVVNHNQVEIKGGLLAQHALDSIGNDTGAVQYGNHHRALHGKVVTSHVHVGILPGRQVGADVLQVPCAQRFHLALGRSRRGGLIVIDAVAAGALGRLHGGVQRFWHMHQFTHTRQG